MKKTVSRGCEYSYKYSYRVVFTRFFVGMVLVMSLPILFDYGLVYANSPKVVVSIKPLHSLVAGVMRGVGEPKLLLKGVTTPHAYALKPSNAKIMHNAQLFFWIGPSLENFLVRIVKNLPSSVQSVAVMDNDSLLLLPNRPEENWDRVMDPIKSDPTHKENHGHGHGHGHDHGQWDPHVWLDPDNARQIVIHVEAVLSHKFPSYAKTFQANSVHVQNRLKQLDTELNTQLASVHHQPFLVYHDAYHYFERHFGLKAVAAVTLNPDYPSGVKRIRKIRALLNRLSVLCLFTEPQFQAPIIQNIIEGYSVSIAQLDPLGAQIQPGIEHYFKTMQTLTQTFKTCLSKGGKS